jgi:hypothetical protein
MKSLRFALLTTVALGMVACSTTGRFVIPPGTQLEVYERPVQLQPDGTLTTAPFFWTAAGIPPGGGVKYRLLQGNKVVKEGRLRAKFRPVSIFWPPFALIYWPMGLNGEITYDLVKDTQK